jgi:predicted DNA-binding transcriptional regulator AlpA
MLFFRFADLKAAGLVKNRPTLNRWIEREGFPVGHMAGKNSRVWTEQEVMQWFRSRPSARKPVAVGPNRISHRRRAATAARAAASAGN